MYELRQIDYSKLPDCVQLIRESFAAVAEEFGFTEENAPRFTAFATTLERLAWQYETGRPMIGYVDDARGLVGYYSLEQKSDTLWELNNLCVLPECRHQRIGETLLRDALERARAAGANTLHIGIVEENAQLRKWYEKHGFLHEGAQKFDFFPFTCGYMSKSITDINLTELS